MGKVKICVSFCCFHPALPKWNSILLNCANNRTSRSSLTQNWNCFITWHVLLWMDLQHSMALFCLWIEVHINSLIGIFCHVFKHCTRLSKMCKSVKFRLKLLELSLQINIRILTREYFSLQVGEFGWKRNIFSQISHQMKTLDMYLFLFSAFWWLVEQFYHFHLSRFVARCWYGWIFFY